jgi:U2-associated protein SR140
VFTAEVHESLRGLLHKQCTLESLAAGPAQPEPEQPKETTTFKSAGFKSSFKRIGEDAEPAAAGSVSAVPPPPPAADIDGEGMNDADSQAIPDQNLDGEALAEDVDGEPLGDEDLDGEDLDGEDLDGEDLDGEAVSDADLDGEALGDDDVDGEVL